MKRYAENRLTAYKTSNYGMPGRLIAWLMPVLIIAILLLVDTSLTFAEVASETAPAQTFAAASEGASLSAVGDAFPADALAGEGSGQDVTIHFGENKDQSISIHVNPKTGKDETDSRDGQDSETDAATGLKEVEAGDFVTISSVDGSLLPEEAEASAEILTGRAENRAVEKVEEAEKVEEVASTESAFGTSAPVGSIAQDLKDGKLSGSFAQDLKSEEPAGTKVSSGAESAADVIEKTEYQVFEISLENVDEKQYQDGFKVEVSLPEDIKGRDFRLFHIHEGEDPVEIPIRTVGAVDPETGLQVVSGFEFKTDGFSEFVLQYTVDFEYSVNGKVYRFRLPGGTKITLSDLAEVLGIIGDMNSGEKAAFHSVDSFLKEVANVEFSDESLVKVAKNEGSDDWTLESLAPFRTNETLTITMKNGDVVTVKVTDAQESSNLGDFLTKVTVSGASLENGNYVVEPGKPYNVTMTFKETVNLQFDNESNLIYELPSGVTFPAGTVKPITIIVVSGGKTYEVAATVTTGENGTVIVKFNENDPNYSKLASATNVSFRVSITAQFTETIIKTEWSAVIDKDIILDTEDHSDVFAQKSGYFDPASGKFYYTVRVTSNGNTTNVNVKDIISGDALIFNNDVQISGNSSSYTANALPSGQKGFDYTFASMADGEAITITYSASLDPEVAKNGEKVTADHTKNTVTVRKEGGDPHTAEFSQEINMKTPDKTDGTEAGTTADGNKLYNWTIDYNPLALVSAAGDVITDTIGTASQGYMKYYGDVTVKVYDHAGALADTRSFTPGSDFGWSYTVPANDTAPYRYVFEYQTVVDQEAVDDGGKALQLTNEAAGEGGKDTGTINVSPKEEVTITKDVESSNPQEVTWVSHIHVPERGLSQAVVTDTLPTIWSGNIGIEGNYNLYDAYKNGTLQISGLLPGESYDPPEITDDKVVITFYKDTAKSQTGLQGTPGGHDITIKLTTTVDQSWLQYSYDHPEEQWKATHTNKIDINTDIEDTAEVVFSKPGLSKSGSIIGGYYFYTLVFSGVTEEPVIIEDRFDTALLEVAGTGYSWNHFKIFGGDQYYQGNGETPVNYSDTPDGILITANSVPRQDNGEFYPYYKITYFLKLKAGVDLQELAVENGGQYDLTNTAIWGDHTSSYTFTTKYDFLDKQILQDASATNRKVKYKITYNLKKGELNGGEDVRMTDRLNEHLSIDYTSIKIETDPAGITIPYSISGDGPETVATYTIPDSTAVTITYDAMVVGNGNVNYINTVEVRGERKTVDKTAEINIEGEGSGAIADLKITKVDGYDANKKLAGVQFKLYAADGRSLSLDEDEDIKEVILETDENGVLHIDGNLYQIFLGSTAEQSVKYYIEEVEAPDGYGTSSFPYQFTLVDDIEGVDYEHFIYFFSDSFQIKNWPLEGLVVGKNVESDETADHTRDFTFEVSILTDTGETDTSVNQTYGDMTFTNGVATFTLKDKEQASAWSMPSGTKFKVEEKDADGFTVSASSGETTAEGAVFTGETSGEHTLVTFNNTKVKEKTKVTVQKVWEPVPDSGSVTVELHRYARITQGTIHLTLTDQNGDPVPGAAFRLYKDGTAQEGTYTTNDSGKITVSNLDKGEYYLKQTDAPDGYSMDDPAPQTDTLTVADVTTVQELDSNLTNTKQETAGSVVYQIHIHGSEMNWNNTVYTKNWYKYYTKGTDVTIEFKVPQYQDIGNGVEVFVNGVSKGTFTNTTSLTVHVTVNSNIEILLDGVTNYYGELPGRCMTFTPDSNATVEDMAAANTASAARSGKSLRMPALLKAPGDSVTHTDAAPASAPSGYAEDSEFTPVSYTLTGGNWSHTFPEQDKNDADGNPYYYYVVETDHTPGEYWIDSYSGDPLSETGIITITNKKEESKVTDFEFSKIWKDIDNQPSAWPEGAAITVTLNAYTDSMTQTPVLEDQTLTFSSTSVPAGWSAVPSEEGTKTTFKTSGLPAVTETGDTLTYYVVETQVTGYKTPIYANEEGMSLINAGKATTGKQIINASEGGVELPSTGGSGINLLYLLGSLLVLLSGALFILLNSVRESPASAGSGFKHR